MSWPTRARSLEVEPSLYAADFLRLGEQVDQLLDAGCRAFHFDMGDGRFIEPVTIGPIVLRALAPRVRDRGAVLDVHLMVVEPERHFEQVVRAGGDGVTFHLEAVADPAATVRRAHELGLAAGIAFNPETEVQRAAEAAAEADLALCMSIHPGYSGQAFMPDAVDRIARLRGLLPERVRIQVDGGIDHDIAPAVVRAGASLLVAGSAIFAQPDIAAAYAALATEENA